MKISTISDVHIKDAGDEKSKKIISFFCHPLVQDSDIIFLLGDIFDLMVGPFKEYRSKYKDVFDKMKELIIQGKKTFLA